MTRRLIIQSVKFTNNYSDWHIETYRIAIMFGPAAKVGDKVIHRALHVAGSRQKCRQIISATFTMMGRSCEWTIYCRGSLRPSLRELYAARCEYLARYDLLYAYIDMKLLSGRDHLEFYRSKISGNWTKYYTMSSIYRNKKQRYDDDNNDCLTYYYKYHNILRKWLITSYREHDIETRNAAVNAYHRKIWSEAFHKAVMMHNILMYNLGRDICSVIMRIIHCGMTSGKII